MKNILVTGAGALLGQGILRALSESDFEKIIFTADPNPLSAGHWLGNVAFTIPKATDENYINEIKKIVLEHRIDAILVGTDVELIKFSEVKTQFLIDFNCKIFVSCLDVIKIANDKFLTCEFLKDNGFPFPKSVMANNKLSLLKLKDELGFPLFAKPVDGARSLGLVKINNLGELLAVYGESSNLVVQEYLPDDLGEYTSGCIVIDGECKMITTLKRDLRDGNTYRAFRDAQTSRYDDVIKNIAEKLKPEGPVNFQFRILNGKPVIFEINCRFSGTTPIRSIFGFNEVEAVLKNYFFGTQFKNSNLKNGTVLRTWSDIFVNEEEINALENSRMLKNPEAIFYNFYLGKTQ